MHEDPGIPEELLGRLVREGEEIWNEFCALERDRFHLFVPSDQVEAAGALARLRGRATSFVELGSAAGVITIAADLLGYEAYGIEREPWLIERSQELADRFDSGAVFAEGTFVPEELEDETHLLPPEHWTPTGGARAFEELGIGLDEFDLIYAYPWPGEEDWLRDMVRRCGRPDSLLLTYDVSEGFRLFEGDRPPLTIG